MHKGTGALAFLYIVMNEPRHTHLNNNNVMMKQNLLVLMASRNAPYVF